MCLNFELVRGWNLNFNRSGFLILFMRLNFPNMFSTFLFLDGDNWVWTRAWNSNWNLFYHVVRGLRPQGSCLRTLPDRQWCSKSYIWNWHSAANIILSSGQNPGVTSNTQRLRVKGALAQRTRYANVLTHPWGWRGDRLGSLPRGEPTRVQLEKKDGLIVVKDYSVKELIN